MTSKGKYAGASVHAVDDVLLAYLDGEMQGDERSALEKHLAGCWACRGQREELSARIKTFMQAREEILPAREVLDHPPVEQFRARLQRHAADSARERSFADRLWLAARRSCSQIAVGVGAYRRATLALVTAAVLLAVTLFDIFTTPLAAETVLLRSESYETRRVPPAGHVRLSSVRIERFDLSTHSGTLLGIVQVAQDSASQRIALSSGLKASAQHIASPMEPAIETAELLRQIPLTAALPAPVLTYLSSEHWLPEVSAREFRKVVQGRQNDKTLTRKTGDELEIHYPFAAGHISGITEAILSVDRETYAPREMSVRTRESAGSWEYRFTAEAESQPERTAEWASVFGSPEVLASRTLPQRSSSIPPPVVASPISYAKTTADEREAMLAETLHRFDTCLGEEVYILPMSDGSLLVQGIVEQTAKRDTLRTALRQLPFPVATRLYIPGELGKKPLLFDSPFGSVRGMAANGAAPVTLADFSNQRSVIYGELLRHFSHQGVPAEEADRKVAEVSNEIVTLSRQTLLHAWALRRLDEEFDPRRSAGLPASALGQIERLRADHRKWISNLARRQAEMLAGLGEVGKVPVADGKATNDQELIDLATQLNSAVRALFAISSGPAGAESEMHQLEAVLHRLER